MSDLNSPDRQALKEVQTGFPQELKEILMHERQKPSIRDLYALRNLDFILQIDVSCSEGVEGRRDGTLKRNDSSKFLFLITMSVAWADCGRNWAWRKGTI